MTETRIGDSIVAYPADRSGIVGQITAVDGQQVYVRVFSKGMFPWLTKWEGWLTLRERDGLPSCAVAAVVAPPSPAARRVAGC